MPIAVATDMFINMTTAIKDPQLGNDVINKRTVVGNEQQSAIKINQALFQKLQCFDVEIVGWLIHHQQVAGFQE